MFSPPDIEKMEKSHDLKGLVNALDYDGKWGGNQYAINSDAAKALIRIGDPTTVKPVVIKILKQFYRNTEMEKDAFTKFGELIFDPIQEYSKSLEDWYLREAVTDYLVLTNHPRAVELLLNEFNFTDPRIVNKAITALAKLKPLSIQPLIKVLRDRDKIKARAAIETLGKIKDKSAVEPILEYLGNDDAILRANAVKALAKIGDTGVAGKLLPLADDPAVSVRKAVQEALTKLGRVDLLKGREIELSSSTIKAIEKTKRLLASDKKIILAFMAQSQPGAEISLFKNVIVTTKSDTEWKQKILSENNLAKGEVIIIAPKDWNPPAIRSISNNDLQGALPGVVLQIKRYLSKLDIDSFSSEEIIQRSTMTGSPITGKVFFALKLN